MEIIFRKCNQCEKVINPSNTDQEYWIVMEGKDILITLAKKGERHKSILLDLPLDFCSIDCFTSWAKKQIGE